MRLIDADAVVAMTATCPKEMDIDSFIDGMGVVLDRVYDAPTVDAVQVVRCKDCVHCLKDRYSDGNSPTYSCKIWDSGTEAEGYCHYGERKDDGDC